jgi:hypothetical protein
MCNAIFIYRLYVLLNSLIGDYMDWIRTGFGEDFLEFDPDLPFYTDYSQGNITNESPDKLIKQTCERIADTHPGPFILMASGGLDSQAMISAWKKSGVPFKVVTARYNNGLNDHDINTLFDFAYRQGIPVEVLDLDIVKFHESRMFKWAEKYFCNSPHYLSYMYIASHLKRGTVISSGQRVLKHAGFTYNKFSLMRFMKISGMSMVPYFWNHDPDLTLIFHRLLDRDHVQKEMVDRKLKIKNISNHESWDYRLKYSLYRQIGLDIIPQDKPYTGFENVKNYFENYEIPNLIKHQYHFKYLKLNYSSLRTYDMFFKYRFLEKGIVYSDKFVTVI